MATNTVLAKLAVLISANNAEFSKTLNSTSSQLKSFTSNINKVAGALGVAFGVQQVANFVGDVVKVTSEFEKFGAVLANTLGSDSAAQQALDEIRVFAQQTPFEVSEITAAFVRWANQGLNPTIDKMAKLGDISSSLGAGFEQTAEAFKDLLVGQTKRIEEIGISAQQSNGKIQLSFKGVNLEIEKSVAGVEEALNVFSQLQGVQGTSAQVAETLGGKISNLKDAYDNFLLTVGSGNATLLKDAVDIFIQITNAASKLAGALSDTDTLLGKIVKSAVDQILLPTRLLLSLVDGTDDANKKLEENAQKLKAIKETADAAFASGNIEAYIAALDQNIYREEIIAEIRQRQLREKAKLDEANKKEIATTEKLGKVRKEAEITPDSIEAYSKAISDLNKEIEATNGTDTERIRILSAQVEGYNQAIERIERLKNSFQDLSATTFKVPDLSALLDPLSKVTRTEGGLTFEVDISLSDQVKQRFEQSMEDFRKRFEEKKKQIQQVGIDIGQAIASSIGSGLSGLGEALGQAIAGVGNFGDNILKVVAGFAKQLGEILIATGVAMLAAKKLITNPYTAIIAGVALVALATAASAAISSSHNKSFGGASGGATGGGRAQEITNNQFGSSIPFELKFRVEGQDLVTVFNSQTKRNGRLSG